MFLLFSKVKNSNWTRRRTIINQHHHLFCPLPSHKTLFATGCLRAASEVCNTAIASFFFYNAMISEEFTKHKRRKTNNIWFLLLPPFLSICMHTIFKEGGNFDAIKILRFNCSFCFFTSYSTANVSCM